MNQPLLSVCLITYNHAPYIRQAIESVLSQKIDFEWEIIIADDCSSDGSREIIMEYYESKREIIKLLFQKVNVGPAKNFVELISSAKGKYIAYLEGDDYWSDTFKLKRQVDFLENNQNYVGCFHNTEERFEEDDKASFLYCQLPAASNVSFNDLTPANLIPSCSVVFKTKLFGNFPARYHGLKMGDWPLHLLNAQFGDFWYMPKVMAVHRLHSKSTWMLQDRDRNIQYVLDAYDTMIKEFGFDSKHSESLKLGKEIFIETYFPKKPNLKRKIKNLFIRVVEKI
jgi:glycosyltransferase involved in cell wall biosynthesis